ncbi:hypothetical protein EPO15_17820 [bacterium]|nr:MAG: hypothetical protein EPO15_17820 [bacterium]
MALGPFLLENPTVFIIPLAAAIVGAHYWLEKARTNALRAAAPGLGLHPTDETLGDLPEALKAMSLFGAGRSTEAKNVLWGERRDYLLFDYQYTVGSGRSSHTYKQTVGAFLCPGRNLPEFTAAPEDLGDWFGELFGGQDIDFEHDPAFSKAYRLRGPDEPAIRDFFSVGGTQYLAARPGWTVHAKGEWLIAYRASKRVSPKKLKDFLWDVQGLYGALFGV